MNSMATSLHLAIVKSFMQLSLVLEYILASKFPNEALDDSLLLHQLLVNASENTCPPLCKQLNEISMQLWTLLLDGVNNLSMLIKET